MTAPNLPPAQTPEEADANSRARARTFSRRLTVFAAFVLVACLTLAFLLQREQQDQASLTKQMCLQRQANTLHTNRTWDALADIERRNKFIDDDIRASRLLVYRNAKLVVPTCKEN